MTLETAKSTIQRENLGRYAWFAEPSGSAANKVCVFKDKDGWVTLVTDERAVVQPKTIRRFDNEEDALADMIEGLHVLKNCLEF